MVNRYVNYIYASDTLNLLIYILFLLPSDIFITPMSLIHLIFPGWLVLNQMHQNKLCMISVLAN